jgi:hypothetical protein
MSVKCRLLSLEIVHMRRTRKTQPRVGKDCQSRTSLMRSFSYRSGAFVRYWYNQKSLCQHYAAERQAEMLVNVGSSRNHSLGFSVSCSRYYDGAQIIKVEMTKTEAPTAQRPAALFKVDAVSDHRATNPNKRSTHGRLKPEFSPSFSTTR